MKTLLSDDKKAFTLEDLTEDYNEDYKKWEEEYNSKPDSIVSADDKEYFKPTPLEERLKSGYSFWTLGKNGRFKLYPTENIKNFIMVDVIDGRTWQVQWHIDEAKRLVLRFY